ncbi:hypothetical protein [Helicobacter cinaedi]|uniref:hypothetical protein n=1 Tax=Helicobacter cinaedi TaxID=213 RepID=UPI0013154ADA|nr:hypothetical protein [Helicobacter cinaedi]
MSGILGFGLCFVIDSFAQVSRPTLFFCFFLVFFGCALSGFALPLLSFCLSPIFLPPPFFALPLLPPPTLFFLPLFFIAYAMGLAFKKIVLRGFVGKLQGFFYAWESGAKMLKVGKNGLFLVVDLLLVGG